MVGAAQPWVPPRESLWAHREQEGGFLGPGPLAEAGPCAAPGASRRGHGARQPPCTFLEKRPRVAVPPRALVSGHPCARRAHPHLRGEACVGPSGAREPTSWADPAWDALVLWRPQASAEAFGAAACVCVRVCVHACAHVCVCAFIITLGFVLAIPVAHTEGLGDTHHGSSPVIVTDCEGGHCPLRAAPTAPPLLGFPASPSRWGRDGTRSVPSAQPVLTAQPWLHPCRLMSEQTRDPVRVRPCASVCICVRRCTCACTHESVCAPVCACVHTGTNVCSLYTERTQVCVTAVHTCVCAHTCRHETLECTVRVHMAHTQECTGTHVCTCVATCAQIVCIHRHAEAHTRGRLCTVMRVQGGSHAPVHTCVLTGAHMCIRARPQSYVLTHRFAHACAWGNRDTAPEGTISRFAQSRTRVGRQGLWPGSHLISPCRSRPCARSGTGLWSRSRTGRAGRRCGQPTRTPRPPTRGLATSVLPGDAGSVGFSF